MRDRPLDLSPPRLAALFGVALLARSGAARGTAVIARDGIGYLDAASRFARGDWSGGLAHHYPPGYPLLVALAGPSEAAGVALAAVASALTAPLAALLAARAWGAPAGLFAGLLAAVLPEASRLGSEVVADGLYLGLVAGAVLAAQRALEGARGAPGWAAGAGLLAGVAYLARPEGLVVLAALLGGLVVLPRPPHRRGWRPRVVDAACLLAPAVAGALPYLVAIRDLPVLGGTQAGSFKLTLKRDLSHPLGALTPGLALDHLVAMIRHTAGALGPALPLVVLGLLPGALAPRRPGRDGAGARLLLLTGGVGLALLAAFVAVRADPRYGVQLALLATPAAGLGAARLAGWLSPRRGALVVAVLVGLVCLPLAVRPRRADKVTHRLAGALLAAAGARRVLAHDSRAAYYAGAEALDLLVLLPDAAARADGAALLRLARARGADAIVLRVPREAAAAARLREALGPPREVHAPEAVALEVFSLRDDRP